LRSGHIIVTLMVQSALVNTSASYSVSQKTGTLTIGNRDTSTSIENRKSESKSVHHHRFAVRTFVRTPSIRLINASCNAFLIKRGLNPSMDHSRLFQN
ncbi:MAG TPA: hypothetical protein VFD18_07455, partial [Chthoniobacterales bacterium]|nr:hypothetical protein [Chthoniobacterales bacterium]